MSRWNPNAGSVVGMEYRVRNLAGAGPLVTVQAASKAAGLQVPSTVTETIETVGVYAQGGSAQWVMLAEAFNAGNEEIGPVTTVAYEPNGHSGTGGWASTEGTFEDALNTGTVDFSRYVSVQNSPGAGPFTFGLEFAAAGFPLAQRVLDVRVHFVVAEVDVSAQPTAVGNIGLQLSQFGFLSSKNIGPASWPAGSVSSSPDDNDTTVANLLSTGEIHPWKQDPWTVGQVQGLDGSFGAIHFAATFPYANESGLDVLEYRIYRVWVEVDYCAENRVQTKLVPASNTDLGWVEWLARRPNAGGNLSKVSGTDLMWVFRQATFGTVGPPAGTSLVFSVPYLRGFQDVPDSGLVYYPQVTIDSRGTVTGKVPVTSDLIGLYMATTAPAPSVDAQPFVETLAVEVTGTVQQEVSGAASADYSGVVFAAYPVGSVGDLTVVLKRRSDDAVEASATFSVDDWAEIAVDPVYGVWKVAQVDFAASVTLAAATQYYLDFSSSGSGSWFVQGLSTAGVSGVGTYDGTTDVATFDGGDVPTADLTAMIMEPIDPITDSSATPVGCT